MATEAVTAFLLVLALASGSVYGQGTFDTKVLAAWKELAENDCHSEYLVQKRVTRADGSVDEHEFVVGHHGDYALFRSDLQRSVSMAGPDGLVKLEVSNEERPLFFLKQFVATWPENPKQVRDEIFEFKKKEQENMPNLQENKPQVPTQKQILREIYGLTWQGIESKFSLSALDDLSKTEWTKETKNGSLLTLEFRLSDKNSSSGVGHQGFVVVDSKNGFRIHSSELITNTRKTKRIGRNIYAGDNSGDFSTTYEIFRMQENGEFKLSNRFEYDVTKLRAKVPIEEFTLAHYGLPLPSDSVEYNVPKWIFWTAMIILGVLLIVAWNQYRL